MKTHAEVVARLQAIEAEVARLREKIDKTDEDRAAIPALLVEFRELNKQRLDMEHDAALSEIREAAVAASSRVESTDASADERVEDEIDATRTGTNAARSKWYRDPWDMSSIRTFGREPEAVEHEFRARALSAIERMPHASDKVRSVCTSLVEEQEDSTRMARQLLATSSEIYTRAFLKLMRNKGEMSVLTQDEARAITRAMSLVDASGGHLIPFQLDPTVILTADGSRNRIRSIARTVTATGDVWSGVSSAGVSGSWDAEAAEVSDDAPTLGQPQIPVHKGAVFVPISIEAQQDEPNAASEVARMIAFEKDRMESVAFVTGTGSGQPTGIVTALIASSPTVVVASAAADTFAVGDVYALDTALPARYADNGTWLGHRGVFNLVRRFDTQGGAGLWTTLGNGLPPVLLGQPAVPVEAMDGVINAAQENYALIYGDFSNYVIADRIGTTVEFIPHLFGANRRPTGQRGWYAHFRVGADSVNDAAFRMLNVT